MIGSDVVDFRLMIARSRGLEARHMGKYRWWLLFRSAKAK